MSAQAAWGAHSMGKHRPLPFVYLFMTGIKHFAGKSSPYFNGAWLGLSPAGGEKRIAGKLAAPSAILSTGSLVLLTLGSGCFICLQ